MESNIPSEIMQYHNRPFPKDDPLLPDAGHVLDYLRGYAEDMCPQVDLKLRHEVKDVGRSDEDNNKEWVLRIQNLDMDQTIKEYYDAVVIANGRYNKAYEPSVPGLDSWKRAYPDSVFHSKFYRNARKFKNKASHWFTKPIVKILTLVIESRYCRIFIFWSRHRERD